MKPKIQHHPAYFKAKSMGDIMLDVFSREQNFELKIEDWSKKAYEVAKQQVSFVTRSNREQLPVYFRQAFTVIMYSEFSDRHSMTTCGKILAELQRREKPYGHCTVIHYLNRHEDAMKFPKANQLYMDVFKAIFNELRRQSYLKRFQNGNSN